MDCGVGIENKICPGKGGFETLPYDKILKKTGLQVEKIIKNLEKNLSTTQPRKL